MKLAKIVLQIGILFIFSFIGNWIQDVFDLFIPGSIIGMIIMFILLITNIFPVKWIEIGSSFLLSHLTLLFIPVTVGIMDYFELFKGYGAFAVLIVFVSSLLVFITSAYASQWAAIKSEKSEFLPSREREDV